MEGVPHRKEGFCLPKEGERGAGETVSEASLEFRCHVSWAWSLSTPVVIINCFTFPDEKKKKNGCGELVFFISWKFCPNCLALKGFALLYLGECPIIREPGRQNLGKSSWTGDVFPPASHSYPLGSLFSPLYRKSIDWAIGRKTLLPALLISTWS